MFNTHCVYYTVYCLRYVLQSRTQSNAMCLFLIIFRISLVMHLHCMCVCDGVSECDSIMSHCYRLSLINFIANTVRLLSRFKV